MAEKIKLNDVVEGMTVYDKRGAKVGTVKFVHNGAGVMANVPDIITLKERIDQILGWNSNLPTAFYPEMYREGFACVGRGFFKKSVIILPSQIVDLGQEAVFLDVMTDELPNC
jgi:hypothetical protein